MEVLKRRVVLRSKKKDRRIISKIMEVCPVTKDELILMRMGYNGTGNTFIRVTIKE